MSMAPTKPLCMVVHFYCHSTSCNGECSFGREGNELICRSGIVLAQSCGSLIIGKYLNSLPQNDHKNVDILGSTLCYVGQ